MITLRQLRYLTALEAHRRFGRAADACAVTQPALSMQIRELERELGVELVERRPGDVSFTEIGMEVVRRAEQVLDVRSPTRFRGEEQEPRPGVRPGRPDRVRSRQPHR